MGNAIIAALEKEMDGQTLFHRFRYHLAAGFIEPLDVVTDYGCGTGYGSEILAQHALDVRAFDKEKANIEYAIVNHRHNNIQYQVANLEEIELPSVDIACCFESIEHLYNPKEFVFRMKLMTKKYIICSVPLNQKLVMVDGDPQEEGDSTHHSVFAQQEFKSMFIDDIWKEFYTLTQGVTFIGVFYNKEGIEN